MPAPPALVELMTAFDRNRFECDHVAGVAMIARRLIGDGFADFD